MSFLKIILRNLCQGPATDPYPFGDTFTPDGLRGKIKYNPQACVACRMCEHVCAGGAIRITETEDKSGLNFTLWHNTCAFCGLCQHYCPTKAIRLTTDFHTAHRQADKYNYVETGYIKYVACRQCGQPMVPVVKELLSKVYGDLEGPIKAFENLCEGCRRQISTESGVNKRWTEESKR